MMFALWPSVTLRRLCFFACSNAKRTICEVAEIDSGLIDTPASRASAKPCMYSR
jgi:hypothetical protein